jgi:hypothetical protein
MTRSPPQRSLISRPQIAYLATPCEQPPEYLDLGHAMPPETPKAHTPSDSRGAHRLCVYESPATLYG